MNTQQLQQPQTMKRILKAAARAVVGGAHSCPDGRIVCSGCSCKLV
jgi:hypothetical protein